MNNIPQVFQILDQLKKMFSWHLMNICGINFLKFSNTLNKAQSSFKNLVDFARGTTMLSKSFSMKFRNVTIPFKEILKEATKKDLAVLSTQIILDII